MSVYAVIVAAGSSVRFGGAVPKQFREVLGKPLLSWTISRFEKAETIDKIVVVVSEDNLLYTNSKVIDPYGFHKVEKIVPGGETRLESVQNGLNALPKATELVAIHDGARPLVRPEDIDKVVEMARNERAAILAVRVNDTLKRAKDSYIISTLDRENAYAAQTPQAFQYDLIMSAHEKNKDSQAVTDDAMLVEALGFKVKLVEVGSNNLKVTTPEDLLIVKALLKAQGEK